MDAYDVSEDGALLKGGGMKEAGLEKELLRMQIRLFRLACKRWNRSNAECADIFDEYGVDDYIRQSYEVFHVQGDDANMDDLENYLKNRGAGYAFE